MDLNQLLSIYKFVTLRGSRPVPRSRAACHHLFMINLARRRRETGYRTVIGSRRGGLILRRVAGDSEGLRAEQPETQARAAAESSHESTPPFLEDL
eukprot:768655-Hanusia_phi.AAC.3